MRFNFKKISAIAASALMTGMTLGIAAASNYPVPFVSGGTPNVAIVYGTGAGVSELDQVQAGNIRESLATYVTGGSTTVEGGEEFALDKSSDHFNFNEALNGVYTDLDDQEMETFLADGEYDEDDVDETFTQKVTPSTNALSLFAHTDYNDKDPTVGFHWTNGQNVLKYDLTFDDGIPFEDLEDTELPLMGQEFYVLDVPAGNTTLVLLDTSEKTIISEGETKTVGDKTVSIEYIASNAVKFNVDGEVTNTLSSTDKDDELADGSYVVATDIMYVEKEAGISKVEFAIGDGKIELITGEDVELNDEDFDGISSVLTGQASNEITGITINWTSDDDSFLTEEDALVMPLFETISLVYGGLTLPDSPEEITFTTGDEMTLQMGNFNLPLIYNSSATSYLGEEDYHLVTKTLNFANATQPTNYTAGSQNTTALTNGLDLVENNRFIVTSLNDDLTDIDTMYYEVTKIDWDGSTVEVQMEDLIGDNDIDWDSLTDDETNGDLKVNMTQMNDTRIYLKFFTTIGTASYNSVVSDKGLVITLPQNRSNETLDVNTGVVLTLTEADYEGDVSEGRPFTVTVKTNSNNNLHVASHNLTSYDEEDGDDVYVGWVPSDLASKFIFDTSADEYDFDLTYYGAEVTADVKVVGGATTITTGTTTLGDVVIKDTEVASFATKNLIVVGGSCINSAAAALVGGAYCGAAWTSATGIGSGQFLIKGYADSSLTSGLALLVAGYEKEDTVKATTYLLNKAVDTSKAYKGTTTTETAVVIE